MTYVRHIGPIANLRADIALLRCEWQYQQAMREMQKSTSFSNHKCESASTKEKEMAQDDLPKTADSMRDTTHDDTNTKDEHALDYEQLQLRIKVFLSGEKNVVDDSDAYNRLRIDLENATYNLPKEDPLHVLRKQLDAVEAKALLF